MRKELRLTFNIYNDEENWEYRYCHNCGEKVKFKDSLKTRQNANGKNIYYYAIYKCNNGHTWNKKIDSFKTRTGLKNNNKTQIFKESKYQEINITSLIEKNIMKIVINLETYQKQSRLDKFLSSKVIDLSRAKIVQYIKDGIIQINNSKVKPNIKLKENDKITILIDKINVN